MKQRTFGGDGLRLNCLDYGAAAMRDARVVELGDFYHHAMLDNPAALIVALREFLATVR